MNTLYLCVCLCVMFSVTVANGADEFTVGNWRSEVTELKLLQAAARTNNLYRCRTDFDSLCAFYVRTSLGLQQAWTSNPRSAPTPASFAEWEKRYAAILGHWEPLSNFGLVHSERSITGQPRQASAWTNLCAAFLDSATPFRVLLDRDLDEGHFEELDTLYLPSVTRLSPRGVDHVRKFVQNGGTLVATGETSLLGDDGKPRADFALADVFGVKLASVRSGEKSRVRKPPASQSEAAVWLNHGKPFCEVEAADPKARVLTVIEEESGTTHPGAVFRTFGKGRVLYYSFCPEAGYVVSSNERIAWREMIINAAMTRAAPPVLISNVVPGIFVNASLQKFDDVENLIVTFANFLAAESAGASSAAAETLFPEVKSHLPRPRRPIELFLTDKEIRAAYALSPDQPHAMALNVKRRSDDYLVELKHLDRFAVVVIVLGEKDLVKELEGDKILKQNPKAPTGGRGKNP